MKIPPRRHRALQLRCERRWRRTRLVNGCTCANRLPCRFFDTDICGRLTSSAWSNVSIERPSLESWPSVGGQSSMRSAIRWMTPASFCNLPEGRRTTYRRRRLLRDYTTRRSLLVRGPGTSAKHFHNLIMQKEKVALDCVPDHFEINFVISMRKRIAHRSRASKLYFGM
jgi:hypothetical protein